MLKERIQQNLVQAMKNKEVLRASVLRLFLSVILNKEKEKRFKINKEQTALSEQALVEASQLGAEEINQILVSEIKKRKDAVLIYEKGQRLELAEKEKKEIEILQEYLS